MIDDPTASLKNAVMKKEACPQWWAFVKEWAANEVAHERHFSVGEAIHISRRKDFVKPLDGERFKCSNTLAPGIARLLVREMPEARDYIDLRHAACDEVPFEED